ncbi:ArsO family NAD(P)H-dependent flavin-containing monooxygenase [Roseisolibacter sp. H3M3-2]|uniref:ArsO family NAD(P)H-dependent flavin-containing monooxygenase n=1 Tax=Roseisolibacter sp. H3M3-2 TaxID=3031323 RepID=UPI0023DA7D21|nr:ArsO family NAD(P)H-dependent flavin-containing monooxygenase [Roseisolibacter sp. H3M3-2]MDF1503219.1 ArsO family NAD(P)H-dependent flavin-containing monooxygenase [Roseisolibacter sp. H3M3-2]
MPTHDVLVIGGGQSALAVGYYLRRTGLSFALLDANDAPGGAWRRAWPSLRLFSPAQWSSIPGWLMPRGDGEYPTRDEALAYLAEYERRYALPVERPVRVLGVHAERDALRVATDRGERRARAVVSATGGAGVPVVPDVPGRDAFAGETLHSSEYDGPARLAGKRVVVVGAGNSGAQIVADLAGVADVTWATREPPRFLPDDVDGRALFGQATARWKALQEGRTPDPPRSLGDVVMVESVRAARDRGLLRAVPMFDRFTARGVAWADGRGADVDAVVWATGFRAALAHLAPLGVLDARGRVALRGTRAALEPRLWLVGYGEWTGFASATLVGVGRTARATADEIAAALA